jgi:hypothetical protein
MLTVGNLSPMVMKEFEDACIGYFDHKEIADDKQVRKTLAAMKDSRVKDWISTKHTPLLTLSFTNFMKEFCLAFLDKNWEEEIRCKLNSMSQGNNTFWEFAIKVQAKTLCLQTPPLT